MNVQETVQNALNILATQVRQADGEYPYDRINLSDALPLTELVQFGYTAEILKSEDADVLPRLLIQGIQGEIEIERCPFAQIALISSDSGWQGTEIAGILQRAGMTAVTYNALENMPDWHGIPVLAWLFPERLSEYFSLLDLLRQQTTSIGE